MTTVLKAKLLAGIFLVAIAIAAPAQTVSTIYQFSNGSNPNYPAGVMAQGQDGNFYGVTLSGNGCCQGIIYKISSEGALTSLYSMAQSDGTTCSGLTLGTDGNFYGTCQNGGTNNYGTLFKVTSAGALTVLHNFATQGSTSDGCIPYAPPIQASNGDFYGTTAFCGADNYGTVYKLTLAGAYSMLYSFQGPPNDTVLPYGLIEGTDGDLWGVGNGWIISGGGIFKITLAGKESLVYTFEPNSDGEYTDGESPSANLIQGSNGNFYGTTEQGGTANEGTIFEVTAGGKETVLYSFPNQTDGAYPTLPLTQGPNGLLYGAATDCAGGGCSQAGLFDITTKGAYKNLYLYPLVCSNCGQPEAPLLLSTNGTFYSTTEQGGTGVGSFYSLSNGYSPFISLVNVTSGAEGARVGILGQGFSSKSVVEFGGTKATIAKLTGTYILATVPTGALTGDVTVTTGSTVLSTTATYKITPTYKSFTPPSGPVGTVVTFNGTGLTQTTKVTIDNISASFTVVSDSEITATVPAGAATGKIVVTTKGGSVSSSTSFTVN
ncbi:MAG: choice-of-anchor tandem repeat GloVer-containing protein [Candidatus Sulfotelmatobacter sp.]